MSSVRVRMGHLAVVVIAGLLASGCALLAGIGPANHPGAESPKPAFEVQVGVGGSGAKSRAVQVFDRSHDIWDVREATPAEFDLPGSTGDTNLLVLDDENQVLVRWMGPSCQGTSSIAVSESGNQVVIEDQQDDGCDASASVYGVVLNYDTNRDQAQMSVEYEDPGTRG